MTQEPNELQKHLAKLIMPQVELIASEKKISKHAAYYLFLGVYPRDENAFSARELKLLKEAAGVIDMPQVEKKP